MLTQYFSVPTFTAGMLVLVFLEGLAAFLSPCVTPMIPVYLLYLGGDADLSQEPNQNGKKNRRRLLYNTGGFVLGFTLLFMALGAGATAVGRLLAAHLSLLSRLGGVVLILMGLQALGVLRGLDLSALFHRKGGGHDPSHALTPLRAVAFGATFAVAWTPCVGAYLGAALTMAGQSASLPAGLLLLFCFSMGLGVPFLVIALLYSRLTGALGWIKRHLRIIQIVSGVLLLLFGLLMLFGVFGYWKGLFG